jgi:catechol 2,3-dioxygenase-like lactoylglutathione lyase family enzyme
MATDSRTLRTVIGVTGMQHVALEVRNLDAAKEFYVDVMGLRVLDRPEFGFPGMWLGLPDGRAVHLIEGHKPPHPGHHFALEIDDMDAAVAALRSHGVEVADPFETAPGAGLQAFINDPSGNVIELNQPHR